MMNLRTLHGVSYGIALTTVAFTAAANAQSLARRISSAPEGRVQFSFPARPGICGNGRSYIQTGPNSYSGSWVGSFDDARRADPCVAGPVRVVLDRADRSVISLQTYVGPPNVDQGTTDLGNVGAEEAVDYLFSLARDAEGRVGREAIMPAMLADADNPSADLLAIARDASRPRETRRSALNWLGQTAGLQGAISSRVTDALLQIARDENDNMDVRRSALGVMARLDHGAGIPPLIELARANLSGDRTWLSKESLGALARSGDPRARDFLRSVVQRTDVADDVLYTAIRGLGTEYATGRDADLLRQIYPRLNGEKSREAVLSALAEVGGTENTRWLLSIARDENASISTRRRALSYASRAGVPTADLVKLYDTTTDPQMKDALIGFYAQSGDKLAIDKLLSIAKNDENPGIRRRTIAQLSRSEDPRVKQFLKDIIER
ncbi:MAG TPA: HEAT repeat domain-containing protein [Gemmatimonadaceae bacterium]|jgi:HEAT repeat protein|nr:HEAT repeat domain-containing protein [Gemmatimonadaceae bacterium]